MTRLTLLLCALSSPALAQPVGTYMDYAREAVTSGRGNQPFAQEALGEKGGVRPQRESVRIVDGDTMDIAGERIRLRSEAGPIDAPELRSAKCPLELFRAEAARDRLAALLKGGEPSIIRKGADRYGRTVAVVLVDGKDVGAILVREGHAKPWPKLTKADRPEWCGG